MASRIVGSRRARLVGLLLLLDPPVASAATLRFASTEQGGVVATGNTLGLSKQTDANGPGTRDSIGTFLSLEGVTDDVPQNAANPWPSGTTNDWTGNGSAAFLDLPAGAEVRYAELVWGGSTRGGPEDVRSELDTPVTLRFGGASSSVTPDAETAQTLEQLSSQGVAVNLYLRSADVTTFVRSHGAGAYEVRGVPGTQHEGANATNAAGWTLVVAFRDDSAPFRSLRVAVGGGFVDDGTPHDTTFTGLCTPPTGSVTGRLTFSALEGDASLLGDRLDVEADGSGTFHSLSGPNNSVDNVACSQLNDATGALDTRGTSGTAKHDAASGVNTVGGRQGFDVSTFALATATGQLGHDQHTLVLRASTTGDTFLPVATGLQLATNAPDLSSSTLSIDRNSVGPGGTVRITLAIRNTGSTDAAGLQLALELPAGLALTAYRTDGVSGDAAGQPVTAERLASGVGAGSVAVEATRTVELELVASGGAQEFPLDARGAFSFVPCAGDAPVSGAFRRTVVVGFTPDAPDAGEVDAGGVDAGGVDAGVEPEPTATGCGCAGASATVSAWLGMALVLRRRRG